MVEDLGPARASERNCNGDGTRYRRQDDTRYIDCPGVSVPSTQSASRSSATRCPPPSSRACSDIYLGGRPGRLMNAGPRSDGKDLLQIKRWPVAIGTIPNGITLRWIRFHDLTRPGSEHPDGIQIMAGRNGKILDSVFERVDIQPIFFRYSGLLAGGGPIEDWTDRPQPGSKKPPTATTRSGSPATATATCPRTSR